jgi:hypothetical protein
MAQFNFQKMFKEYTYVGKNLYMTHKI